MPTPLSLTDTIVASDDQVAADLSEEMIILGMTEGVYFSVSDVAARIWALVQTPRRLSDIVTLLTSDYEVAPDQCSAEVLAFAEELVARGLAVRLADAAR